MIDKSKYRKNKRDHLDFVVYAVQAGEFVKVGIAENLKSRMVVFRCHNPLPIKVVYCSEKMQRPDARYVEKSCHAKFYAFSTHGEWFKVGVDDVVAFLRTITKESCPQQKMQLRLV